MKRHILWSVCLLVLFSLWGTLSAGEWDYFFSSNVVTALCPVDDAYWIGTTTGLLKMDPASVELTHYHMGNSALPSNNVMSVVEGWDGRIWVGTYDGLASFDGENWELWTPERLGSDEYTGDIVSSMIADDSDVWVCFQNWEADIGSSNASTDVVRIGPDKNVWGSFDFDMDLIGFSQGLNLASTRYETDEFGYGSNDKILMYDGKKSLNIDLGMGYDDLTYALGSNGDLLFMPEVFRGSEEGSKGLYIHRNVAAGLSADKVERLSFPGKSIDALANDKHGNIYAVVDGKPWFWTGETWTDIPAYADKYIRKPGEENIPPVCSRTTDGKILASDGNRLLVIDGSTSKTYDLHISGLTGLAELKDMVVDSSGKAWFATIKELVSYDGVQWTRVPYQFTTSSEWGEMVKLAVNSEGSVWLQHHDDIYCLEGNKLVKKKEVTKLIKIIFDLRGEYLWALSDDKLLCFYAGTWNQITTKESGLPSKGLLDICVSPLGHFGVLSQQKIFVYNGSTWKASQTPTQNGFFSSIACDSRGTFYLINSGSNYEGYYSLRNGRWTQESAFGPGMLLVTADKNGGWWCWTSFPGPGDGWAYHHNGQSINQVPGSPYGFCNGIYIDSNNNKWFILPDEIAVYNEDGIKYPSSWSKTGSVGE